jgi:hypothetical protein
MRLFLAASALVLATAGVAHAEVRNLSGFTKVDANAGTDVQVTVGGAFRVEVTGRDAARIITRVEGDTLIVQPQRGFSWRGRQANIRVTMPSVDGFSASSGADLIASGVNAQDITLDSSSGAVLRVSGACRTFTADASSGADLDARNLRCESGAVDVSSGADARVFATGRIDIDASSGGGVLAYGNPAVGNIDLSSGGSFRRAE